MRLLSFLWYTVLLLTIHSLSKNKWANKKLQTVGYDGTSLVLKNVQVQFVLKTSWDELIMNIDIVYFVHLYHFCNVSSLDGLVWHYGNNSLK